MKRICVGLLVLVLVASVQATIIDPRDTTEIVTLAPEGMSGAGGDPANWIGDQWYDTWRDRTDWASVPGIIETTGYRSDAGTDYSLLRTTITGLDPYEELDVYVLFGTAYNESDGSIRKDDGVRAELDTGQTSISTAYTISLGNAVDTGLVSRVEEGTLWYGVSCGYLGNLMADETGNLSILIDAVKTGAPTGDRTLYHGLAIYECPIPEPATMTLLGFGALALLRKRK